MDDQEPTGKVTRLGPDSGGRSPDEPVISYREWSWSSDDVTGRRGLPFLGVFLLAFGALLLLETLFPGTSFWSWLALAAGLASLVVGWQRRSSGLAAVGILLIAIGLPSLLTAIGIISGPGWGSLFLGIALVVIGLARRRGRIGWQVWLGALLIVVGASQRSVPWLDELVLPLAIIVVGGLIVGRAILAHRAAR